jgi:hypothetical protein
MKTRYIIIILVVIIAGGCTTPQMSRSLLGTVHLARQGGITPDMGEGLYIMPTEFVQTNATDSFSIQFSIGNGYKEPVFLNKSTSAMFPAFFADDSVVAFDDNGYEVARGVIDKNTFLRDGHPEQFYHINPRRMQDDNIFFYCCNSLQVTYENNFAILNPTNSIDSIPDLLGLPSVDAASDTLEPPNLVDIDEIDAPYVPPFPIPTNASKVVVSIPVQLEYLVEGEWKQRVCRVDLKVIVIRKKEANKLLQDTANEPPEGDPFADPEE